jgi:hypothetical protein
MNNWPKWFPYPISWIRGFALTYTLAVLVGSQIPFRYNPFRHNSAFLVVLIQAWVTVPFLFTFLHWVIGSIVKFLLAHLPTHPKLEFVRQYLADRWSGRQSHWREGLNAFIVSFAAFVITAFVLVCLLPVPERTDFFYEGADSFSEYQFFLLRRNIFFLRLNLVPIGMLIVSPYLYQYDLWVRHGRAAKSASKVKAQE